MITVAISIQKGGSGKTTTTVNLGAALARLGLRVLLVDLDQQGNLTSYFVGVADELDRPTVYDLFLHRDQPVEPIKLWPGSGFELDLLPANTELAAASWQLQSAFDREHILAGALLDHYANQYDYVLLDCPPALDILTINALTAANFVLMPVLTELLPYRSLLLMVETIARVKKRLNPNLEVWRVLPSMFDTRMSQHKDTLTLLRQNKQFGDRVYRLPMQKRASYGHAVTARSDVRDVDPEQGEFWEGLAGELVRETFREVAKK